MAGFDEDGSTFGDGNGDSGAKNGKGHGGNVDRVETRTGHADVPDDASAGGSGDGNGDGGAKDGEGHGGNSDGVETGTAGTDRSDDASVSGNGDGAEGGSRAGSRRRSDRDVIASLDKQIARLEGRRAAVKDRVSKRRARARTSYMIVVGATLDAMAERGEADAVAVRDRIVQTVDGHNRKSVDRWHALKDLQ